jgi:membrane-bound metal-dependent hydrolase YbcI (DUF457 family)
MPQAVLHILVPLILIALFKDWYDKRHKKKFPLRYVLIAGIAGIIPDLDIAAFWVLHFIGLSFNEVHRTFAHTIFVPLIFFFLFLIFKAVREKEFTSQKLKLIIMFLGD